MPRDDAAAPTYTALRAYNNCVAGLMTDPQVTGDLLLIGLWFARAVHLGDPPKGEGRWSDTAIAATVFGPGVVGAVRFRTAMAADVPPVDPDTQAWGTTRGGALARHLPQGRWTRIWSRFNPDGPRDAVPPPPMRPALALVRARKGA